MDDEFTIDYYHRYFVNPKITFPVNNTPNAINYTILLTATRNDGTKGCIDTTSRNIIVYPKPSALFTPSKDSGCTPLLVNFTNTSDPKNGESINSMSFIWKFGASIIDTFKDQSKTFTNSGTNDSITFIQLIATSKWGCRDTIKDTVTVFPLPKADFFLLIIHLVLHFI
ncbi:MAG: hypothetical protein IPK03_06125 [Bacteroidetes bacterium]|nr:hypothetical protein [Bacteroidota bacterium]